MPNWCTNHITIEGGHDTLAYMDLLMKADAWERSADDDPEMGQPMQLVPMPAVLRGTRSPAPTGRFDHDGRLMALVNDPSLEHWTPERYEVDKAEHYALVERAEQAKAETGYSDWYSWATDEWGTKWSMEVFSYTFDADIDPEVIRIEGQTAWAPPTELLQKVSEKFDVKIGLTYCEPGMDFIGASVIVNGVVSDSSGAISEHLPSGFDWDDNEAQDIHEDLCAELISEHEQEAWQAKCLREGREVFIPKKADGVPTST